jgi:hypothetical protein
MISMQGPLAKLDRAVTHVDSFEAESRSIIEPSSYQIVHELDKKNGTQSWRFDSPTPVVPIRVSTIIGDALFNYRSALDQLVWQLVLANDAKPGRYNSFPIAIAHKFGTEYHKKCLAGISLRAFSIIKSFQPKPGKNWDLLFLPELNDIDKHRHLNLFVVWTGAITLNIDIKPGNNVFSPQVGFGKVEKGKVLCTIPIEHQDVRFQPTFGIQIAETDEDIPGPVLTLLRNIEHSIRDIFIQLESEMNKR